MSERQRIKDEITSVVYQQLFGYPRHELLKQAKQIAGDDWGFLSHGGDLDEQMRDWMCIEALDALGNAEEAIGHAYYAIGRKISTDHAKKIAKKIASQYAVDTIWQQPPTDESDDA